MTNEALETIIDFSEDIGNAEAPPPLPKGVYPAEIKGAVKKVSDKTGKAYGAVQFFISPDAYPADFNAEVAPEGITLNYMRVPLEDDMGSRFRLRKFCESIGAPMSKRIDLNSWLGLTANVEIDHDVWEGVTRANITKVQAPQ